MRILIVDDNLAHLEILKDSLAEAAMVAEAWFKGHIPAFDTQHNAVTVANLIREAAQTANFPYDIIISDLYMPLDPARDTTPHPEGGAVRIYDEIKKAGLTGQVFLAIVTNMNPGVGSALTKIRSEQRELNPPWATICSKPSSTPGPTGVIGLLDPQTWIGAMIQAIRMHKDRTWRDTFIRASLGELVGRSSALREALVQAEQASRERIVVLQGESGTGKQLIANAIATFKGGPYRSISVLSVNPELLESEVFGHLPGAFTGATVRRLGALEICQHGVVFFDEFDPAEHNVIKLEMKLRTVLARSRDFYPLGSLEPKIFEGTIIFGGANVLDILNDDPKWIHFRSRLSGPGSMRIRIAPLRERKADIPPLAEHFLELARIDAELKPMGISPAAMHLLLQYPWPGNIRELEGAMQFAAKLPKPELLPEHLPEEIQSASGLDIVDLQIVDTTDTSPSLAQLLEALCRGGNISKAGKILWPSLPTANATARMRRAMKRVEEDKPEMAQKFEAYRERRGRPKKQHR